MEIQLVEILAIAMVVALVARQVRLPYTATGFTDLIR